MVVLTWIKGLKRAWFCYVIWLVIAGCSTKSESLKNDAITSLPSPVTAVPSPTAQAIEKANNQMEGHLPTPSSKEAETKALQSNTLEIPKEKVKGIYVSAWSAVGKKFDQLIELIDQSDLNAMVIDVKNDSGQVTYASGVPLVKEIGADTNVIITDMKAKLQQLKQRGIYSIARIVVFKDPYLGAKRSDLAIMSRTGDVWKDKKGVAWVDPYKQEVWDYNVQIAKEAASLGFNEVQFDYVRFPENGEKVDREVYFDNPHQWTKAQVIEGFLKKAKEQIGGKAYLSADVFGLTTSSNNDMGIGQDWSMISKQVNFISPMLYPSHYSSGIYGVKNPDLQPYAIISKAIDDALIKNTKLMQTGEHIAEIRPWYQDFTATWVKSHKKYGEAEVNEQIKAAKEHGVEQFLLWNSNSVYSYR